MENFKLIQLKPPSVFIVFKFTNLMNLVLTKCPNQVKESKRPEAIIPPTQSIAYLTPFPDVISYNFLVNYSAVVMFYVVNVSVAPNSFK